MRSRRVPAPMEPIPVWPLLVVVPLMLLFFVATRPSPAVSNENTPAYEVKYRWMDRRGEIRCRIGAADGMLYPCTALSPVELDKLRVDWSDPTKKK